jgi:hypothetical protein
VNAVNRAADDYEDGSDDGRSELDAEVAGGMMFDMISSADVALRLGCSKRHVTSIATRLDGRKVAGRWCFPSDVVELEAARRAR